MPEILIHTDGGCSGNPGPGAWAYVMRWGDRLKEESGFEPDTTNNKMELTAVIRALDYLSSRRKAARPGSAWASSPILVFTDSQYVRNGITSWVRSWKARGWKTADKKPVKNRELWMELDSLAEELNPSFHWVEGHAGEPDNERCDDLVQERIKENRAN
ncbi:MAG TPA: ribonuclease HI [Rectinemataceae bacterium]